MITRGNGKLSDIVKNAIQALTPRAVFWGEKDYTYWKTISFTRDIFGRQFSVWRYRTPRGSYLYICTLNYEFVNSSGATDRSPKFLSIGSDLYEFIDEETEPTKVIGTVDSIEYAKLATAPE